jgi:hypothetical protein
VTSKLYLRHILMWSVFDRWPLYNKEKECSVQAGWLSSNDDDSITERTEGPIWILTRSENRANSFKFLKEFIVVLNPSRNWNGHVVQG